MEATVEISDDEVKEYVRDNLFLEDIFPKKDIIDWVSTNCDMEEVFSRKALESWAINNGYLPEK